MPRLPADLIAALMLGCMVPFAQAQSASAPPAPKVLRLVLGGAENGFDPAQISDVVSAALVGSIFDAPLTYDYLARPAKLEPRTAVAMPEVSDNYRRYVFRIRPGLYFADDPAFKGKKRELVAADYVYSVKRYYDPKTRSPTLFHFENAGLLGLSELRREAIANKTPFPYDTEVEGIRAIDRYTFEVRLAKPAPRLPYVFANSALTGAVAREVIEAYEGKSMEHPVGTGPFRLAAWKRASRIVLERNPAYDLGWYDEDAPAGDAVSLAIAKRLKGRKLPMLDRVEIAIVEEAQPRWLAFLNREVDLVPVPFEFTTVAAPNGRLAPNLAKQGIQMRRGPIPTTRYTYFGMENPITGGYAPERVALRRALALAYDGQREIALLRRGQAMPAQTVIPPQVSGYDPLLKTEMSDHDLPRARALLDLYGYVDRDGDGWRDQPDGKPLVLEFAAQPDQISRQSQDLWKKAMDAIKVRIDFRIGTWQEQIKASRAGKLMMWGTGWSAALPDGSYFLDVLYGPNKGQSNHSRFDHPEFNALHERQRVLPDGPERDRLIASAMKLAVAQMPIKATAHDVGLWLAHSHVVGYVPHPFIRDYWRYLDVEPAPAAP
jgi:ABC-type transport system substrate-binding protein